MIKTSMTSVIIGMLSVIYLPAAHAEYPERPVTIVVAFSPGGGTDLAARYYAERLTARLGQPVVVENKAGANGTIGAASVARARPDGYTLLYGSNSTLSAAPYLYSKLTYDPIKDFTGIVRLGDTPSVLIANIGAPYKTFDAFIDYAKAHPGKLSWAHANTAHLAGGASLTKKAGLDMVPIPYKSSIQGITDVIGNQVPLMVVDLTAAISYITSGKVIPLAVTSKTRSPNLPDVPAMSEKYPGIDVFSWTGLVAPKGTPDNIIQKLNRAGAQIATDPEVVEYFKVVAAMDTTKAGPSEGFNSFIQEQVGVWNTMLTDANVERQ